MPPVYSWEFAKAIGVGALSPPAPTPTWQQLTVAAHSRKVISTSSPTDSATYSALATGAQADVEALPTQTVSAIPARGYNVMVAGDRPGTFYITGSLHSGYRGNEIDKMVMPFGGDTVITTAINHQPQSPPRGPNSGYAAGTSGYIYKQTYTPESVVGFDDQTEAAGWQPFKGHNWTMATWTPYHGYAEILAHAVQSSYPDGPYTITSGVLQSSFTQPSDGYVGGTRQNGLVGYDWTAGKYRTHLSQLSASITSLPSGGYPFTDQSYGLGTSGLADWNNWDQSLLFFNSISNSMNVLRWNPITGVTVLASMVSSGSTAAIPGMAGGDGHSQNGWLIRNLEQRKYLMLAQNLTGRAGIRLYLYSEDFGTGAERIVDLAPSLPGSGSGQPFDGVSGASDPLTFCVDRNSRRVFWLVAPPSPSPIRLYVSTFNDLMTWTQVTTTGTPTWADSAVWHTLNRQPLHFANGYLFLHDNATGPNDPGYQAGAMNLKRVKVDTGEDLPAMNFTRYDYRKQTGINTLPNYGFTFSSDPGVLQLWGVKHANWAYRPDDGKHYLCAGDLGSSTCGSMATLAFSGTGESDFLFTETLNETTNPPSGKVRPSSPDDGHWFLVPDTSPWVAGRGKFVFMRAGDGEPMFYNAYLRTKYVTLIGGVSSSNGTQAQVAAALADGWDIQSKLYLFDPATTSYEPLGATLTADFSTCAAGVGGSLSSAGMTYAVTNTNGWTQDNGSTFFPSVWTASSASSRNGAFDTSTGVLWRFYSTGSPSLASFNFVTKVVKFHSLARWLSPETGRNYYTSGAGPSSDADIVADGAKPRFGNLDSGSGLYITPLGLEWEHKATWIDERDGKLYVVNPVTGYLWCFETRATATDGGDGWLLPFYPVGSRIPFNGVFPPQNARDAYPPTADPGKDSRMQQFLVPYKGGLLFWGSALHDSGTFGYPRYAFWRRLGFTGDWTVVSMPQEFAANTFSVVSKAHDNSEVVLLSGGGNYLDTQGPWPFFWRLT